MFTNKALLVELTPFILIRGVIRLVEVLVMIEAIGQTHSRVQWPKVGFESGLFHRPYFATSCQEIYVVPKGGVKAQK